MDLNTVKETIQDFFQENTVTIVGSGLSAAEGISGMKELADYLVVAVPKQIKDPLDISLWDNISSELAAGKGLEAALLIHAPSENLESIIRDLTAKLIGDTEKEIGEEVFQGKRILRFSEYLEHFNLRNNGLTVVTPNYDRLVEYACEYKKIRVDTLFIGNYFAHFNPNQSKYMFCEGRIKRNNRPLLKFAPRVSLYKPHGCLSWHMIDNEPYSIPTSRFENCLIITPGINKYHRGYNSPFDIHRTKANEAIDAAERFIVSGYGFNDDHLETHLVRQLQKGKPALIISRSIYNKARNLVKKNNNIIALCKGNDDGTVVLTSTEQCYFDVVNLWDLHEMLKEVF